METRVCRLCNTEKDISCFSPTEAYRCKPCRAEQQRNYRRNNRKQASAVHRLWKYSMTKTEYESLFQFQEGVCAICLQPESEERWAVLCVDHNHDTGEIRGLLCQSCNRGLAHFKDDIMNLIRATEYLIEAPTQQIRKKQYANNSSV